MLISSNKTFYIYSYVHLLRRSNGRMMLPAITVRIVKKVLVSWIDCYQQLPIQFKYENPGLEIRRENFRKLYLLKPVLVAARSKASVYGRSPAETMASNPERCLEVCLL